jgi:hypothetical protein
MFWKIEKMELSKENVKTGLTSNTIKIIAIVAMTVDHIAWTFFPHYSLDAPILFMKIIGRLTAPIMMFFVAEGYYHTKNIKRYIFRLFVFAIISHFAYAIAFDKYFIPFKNSLFDQTSIIWALMLGLIALAIRESKTLKIKIWQKHILIFIIIWMAFPADWSAPAALAVLYMGISHGNFKKQMISLIICIGLYSIVYAIFLNIAYGILQMLIVLAIPILYQYNGQSGKWRGMKWFFYIYYPAHMIIFGFIRIFILQKGIN